MDIAVIGAGGAVGRQIVILSVAERLLERDQRLILVGGDPEGASAKSLQGFAVDLMDAYAEICPRIEVALTPEDASGDLIVMAAGGMMTPAAPGDFLSRDGLAPNNFPIFERYAAALAKHGHGNEIVICVSNPNELAVAVFARYLGKKRVIGMGSFLDSLRFRKEIAFDLGIRRQRIHGFIVGEHGAYLTPLWSSVHIYGFQHDHELQTTLNQVRQGRQTEHFRADLAQAQSQLTALIAAARIQEAYALVNQYPPDIRAAFKPFVTHYSGAKTAVGTAKATLELLRAITLGNDAFISGQVCLDGEFYGLRSTIGVPIVIGNQGVEEIVELPITSAEEQLLRQSAQAVQQKISAFLPSEPI